MREQIMTQRHLVAIQDALSNAPLTREVEDLRLFFKGLTVGGLSGLSLTVASLEERNKAVELPEVEVRQCRCGGQLRFRLKENSAQCPKCGITTTIFSRRTT